MSLFRYKFGALTSSQAGLVKMPVVVCLHISTVLSDSHYYIIQTVIILYSLLYLQTTTVVTAPMPLSPDRTRPTAAATHVPWLDLLTLCFHTQL